MARSPGSGTAATQRGCKVPGQAGGTAPGRVGRQVAENRHVLEVLSTKQLVEAWERKTGKDPKDLVGSARTAANYASPVLDSVTVGRLIADLGVHGRIALKTVSGRQYVIFKGAPGVRSLFTGTRYLAKNAKVVDMAIGRIGVAKSVVKGARLTVFLVVPLNVLGHILDDSSTLSRLIGTTGVDIAKIGLSAYLAGLAATTAAGATTLAAGPLVVAIAVGVGAGWTLDALDRHFGVTEALIDALDAVAAGTRAAIKQTTSAWDRMWDSMARGLAQFERELIWRADPGAYRMLYH